MASFVGNYYHKSQYINDTMGLSSSQLSKKQTKLIFVGIILFAFLVGLVIPSPFFRHRYTMIGNVDDDIVATMDTVGMVMPNGAVYEGSVNVKNKEPHGFGVLNKAQSTYEGNWKNGKLRYGKRTTDSGVYEGRFDDDLNNHGFGITHYSPQYIQGKRNQGLKDNEIIATYIGNWRNNEKDGLGRAIKVDSSIDFGHYKGGIFQPVEGANYKVGKNVYGIDVSHHQKDINWDNLALYCDSDGKVYSGSPKEKKYMQPVFFAYIKATEGATLKDRTYDIRAVEAERHGISKGAYHFLHLGNDINEQIKNFTETATWTPGDLPPALDVELESEIKTHGVAKLLDMTFTWLETIEDKMGVRPIIYTRESIRDKYISKDPRFKKYQCWIARYHPDGPVNKEWKLWQLSEKGRMNGHDDSIDINLYKDDYTAFRDYLDRLDLTQDSAIINQ